MATPGGGSSFNAHACRSRSTWGRVMGNCEICGEPMPAGEEVFRYHGYSGPCPVSVARGGIIRVDSLEKVREKLATTEKTTIAIAREAGGKIRVTSGSWEGEKVILKDQVLEVRNVDGRLYVSRKAKKPDEWDPPITV
jgi:hypothetical protein